MVGKVLAVCISPKGGIPKYPQPHVVVGQWGLFGDYHNREMRPSFSKPDTLKPNVDRHISLVAIEVLEELGEKYLGMLLKPGELSENITTKGLGDLSQITDGTRLSIGEQVILRVVEQNQPCKNVRAAYGLEFYKQVTGRRGILCAIEKGVGATIHPGDFIEVLKGGEPVVADSPPDTSPPAKAKALQDADA